MAKPTMGFDKNLFVLPFDHKSTFERGLLGIIGRQASPPEVETISAYKLIIYDGLLKGIENGVPVETTAVSVDQKYGGKILEDAKQKGIITCIPVEKSGQAEFNFEYGEDFGDLLKDASPTFAKALVRYNPDGDADINKIQVQRLKQLSDYAHSENYKFMFELLVPATAPQLESIRRDHQAYHLRLRPALMVRTISELQEAGIEPDVWKLEGTEDIDASRNIVAQAHEGKRDNVGVIVLGRGEDEHRVIDWLTIGAQTKGIIGFAIGRTVFWQSLLDLRDGKISRTDAVSQIGDNYHRLYKLFVDERAKTTSL
jgi:myo-inositol catabolism protein IolC